MFLHRLIFARGCHRLDFKDKMAMFVVVRPTGVVVTIVAQSRSVVCLYVLSQPCWPKRIGLALPCAPVGLWLGTPAQMAALEFTSHALPSSAAAAEDAALYETGGAAPASLGAATETDPEIALSEQAQQQVNFVPRVQRCVPSPTLNPPCPLPRRKPSRGAASVPSNPSKCRPPPRPRTPRAPPRAVRSASATRAPSRPRPREHAGLKSPAWVWAVPWPRPMWPRRMAPSGEAAPVHAKGGDRRPLATRAHLWPPLVT